MAYIKRDHPANCEPIWAAINQITAHFNWKLLNPEEFIQAVEEQLRTGQFSNAGAAALYIYSTCLFAACCGYRGDELQNQAFAELYYYLTAISYRRSATLTREQRQDVVNDAILAVWQNLSNYRNPGAFLANTRDELLNALRRQRTHRRQTVPLEDAEYLPSVSALADPLEAALHDDLRQTLHQCFRRMLRNRPNSQKQLATVWLKFMRDFDDQSISHYFAQTVANVHVLRSRGLKQLRADPALKSTRFDSA
jgi:DNA-directed RNA polymerase specialized sigma24 family protein